VRAASVLSPALAAALVTLGAAACTPRPATSPASAPAAAADALLAAIDRAHEDYDLAAFYAESERFLSDHADHPKADAVRYDLALQLVSENLARPDSAEAERARAHLEALATTSRDPERRFDAALLQMKFAPTEVGRRRDAEAMLRRFAEHPRRDQIYYWLIADAEGRGDLPAAAGHVRALLDAFPELPDGPRYALLLRRAEASGRPFPFPPELIAAARGRPVLVDFWASWCAPCRAAAPALGALVERCGERCAVVGLSLDEDDAACQSARAAHGMRWPNLRVGVEADGLAATLGVSDLPAYFVVGADGRVVATELGLDASITRLLELAGLAP
jgi:thiol-disulfide isomerase/thioredoxin